MKWMMAGVFGILLVPLAHADFATPLADWPVGTNATGKVLLLATNSVNGTTNYTAGLYTDAIGDGPEVYPAVFANGIDPSPFIGKWCFIEAWIERDDTSPKGRRFRIIKVEPQNRQSK